MKTPMLNMVGCKRNYIRSCRGPENRLGTAGARWPYLESYKHGEQFSSVQILSSFQQPSPELHGRSLSRCGWDA